MKSKMNKIILKGSYNKIVKESRKYILEKGSDVGDLCDVEFLNFDRSVRQKIGNNDWNEVCFSLQGNRYLVNKNFV